MNNIISCYSCPLSSVRQKTLRASWTSFSVLLMKLQHRYSTGVQNEEGYYSQSLWWQRQIKPGMSKHLSTLNSTQLLACCSFVFFTGRSSTLVNIFRAKICWIHEEDTNHQSTRDTVTWPPQTVWTRVKLDVTVPVRRTINRPCFNIADRHNGIHNGISKKRKHSQCIK